MTIEEALAVVAYYGSQRAGCPDAQQLIIVDEAWEIIKKYATHAARKLDGE